jgi:transposase-like protein
MDTIQGVVAGGRRRRRRHSAEFKAAVVAECSRRGVSIAAVALANGLNANLVRRWVVEQERCEAAVPALPAGQLRAAAAASSEPFVPVSIQAAEANGANIRVEIRSGEKLISVHWPIAAAHALGAWLGTLLR